jgi:hypothetical protein
MQRQSDRVGDRHHRAHRREGKLQSIIDLTVAEPHRAVGRPNGSHISGVGKVGDERVDEDRRAGEAPAGGAPAESRTIARRVIDA